MLSFFCADGTSFFFAAGELAGEASVVGEAFVSGVAVGVDAEVSTLAEAVSCGVAKGLSSCPKAEAAKLNAAIARSDVNSFISISFPNLWIFKRRLHKVPSPTPGGHPAPVALRFAF